MKARIVDENLRKVREKEEAERPKLTREEFVEAVKNSMKMPSWVLDEAHFCEFYVRFSE